MFELLGVSLDAKTKRAGKCRRFGLVAKSKRLVGEVKFRSS